MNMKTIILLASMTTLCATSFADVVYKNDFSSRTSKSPVPYGEWREAPYQTGAFVNDSYNDPFSGTAFQDCWIRGRNNCSCPVHIVSGNGNPEVVMHNAAGENKHVIVKHRLGNTFTDGIVTAQCDLRAPATWTGYGFVQEFMLGDENFFSPETETADNGSRYLDYRAMQVGVGQENAGAARQFTTLEGGARKRAGQASATTWYRVVVTVDLDTRKYGVAFYDMGDAHPALDAATPSEAAFEKTGIAMSFDAVTSISSLGLSCYSPHGGADAASLDLSLAGQFDNIRVAHNGVECYVNDFATRRSRALGGTTAGSYAAASPVSNTVGTETYTGGESLYKESTGDKTVGQPVGTDGWRRLNSDLKATPAVYSDGGNLTMRFSPSTTGIAAATIGQTLTTGKVRISADVRATGIAGNNNNQGVYLYAGSDALYNANYSQFGALAGLFARIGIVGTSTTVDGYTYRRPYYRDASGAKYGTTDDEWVKQGTWLRFTIEANLDAGTYSCTIRDQGTTHPGGDTADGDTIYFSKSGIGRINTSVSGISCVVFSVYSSEAMFDNIKVWHAPTGAAEETLVYDNRFNSRTINYENFLEGALVGSTIAKSPAGQDGWARVNNGSLKAVVREDVGNPALTFNQGSGNLIYAVHDIGTLCKYRELKTQVDACPPAGWLGGSRGALFWLAGDAFHEGNLKKDDEFYKHSAFAFGFNGASNNEVKLCVFNGSYAYNDDLALDPSHWYRFVATTQLNDGTSDIAVYDLGTEHPTFETPTPAASVATFKAIPFRRSPADLGGISAIGFSAMGTMDNTLDNKAGVFWDNILLDYRNDGLLIVVR